MDAVCVREDGTCQAHALAAALHSLSLYCAAISTALICCCSSPRPRRSAIRWRGQNIRGIASLALGVIWCCGAASASLRPGDTVKLVGALMAPFAWVAAAAMHISLWTRRTTAPILYLVIYWFLSSATSGTIAYRFILLGVSSNHVEIYVHGVGMILAFIISGVDWLCFYDEVKRSSQDRQKRSIQDTLYKYDQTHFYSKITFFWLNRTLYNGYWSPIEKEDLGNLPENEQSQTYFDRFKKLYRNGKVPINDENKLNIWQCYMRMVWPNFYIAGILKLFGDLVSVIPALGLAAIIQFVDDPIFNYDSKSEVTIEELLSNGYAMLVIVTLALILQALLSQNSTHLITVEGTRLKMALQSTIFDKCTRLSLWSTGLESNEDSPLLEKTETEANSQSGLLTNLISQDTYNIMSCVWIFHYTWAIPLKVIFILYLLYTKLGPSAIIGTAISLLIITPSQLYIGKKISDNAKDISKCTDHRISKISEILQGMNVIKLYVWEDLFNEKILQLREVELKILNKDSTYWGILTFTMQVSGILVTVITFTMHYYLENTTTLNVVNVFAGLALFNQLTIPLLILPVTVLMIIQAMVSSKRIKDFLELPESYNARLDNDSRLSNESDKFNATFLDASPEENPLSERDEINGDNDENLPNSNPDRNHTTVQGQEYLMKFRNAAFSWKMKDFQNAWLEIDELDIPAGKLVMVVGASGSGKSSLLSAILGELHHEKGEVNASRHCSMWYSGQPPWLLEGTIKDNIVMGSTWCAQKYARVLRATGLRPDLQLLPDGDNTCLGSYGTPLSGGQKVRLCIARALYSRARLIILDEPFGALDAILARQVVVKALLPAARAGRSVVLATNRLELLHYADMVIAMEDGRVNGVGRFSTMCEGVIGQWAQLAAEARMATGRAGAGPPGGSARERLQLLRAISRKEFQRQISDDTLIEINEVIGAHLLTEVPMCIGGSWRRTAKRIRLSLSRQLSSPPSSMQRLKWSREVRRAVSADATNEILQHEASLLRRIIGGRPYRTLSRWTPRTLQRLLSFDNETSTLEGQNNANGMPVEAPADATFTSITSNGIETSAKPISQTPTTNKEAIEPVLNESTIWWEYARACGWWGAAYVLCAAAAQAVALTADYWLSLLAAENSRKSLTDEQTWNLLSVYALWSAGGVCVAGGAQVACACAGAASRRALHERLLYATLHAPINYHNTHPAGDTLHRFSSDTLVIDKKLPTAINRWAQLAFLCSAAIIINIVASPWTLLAMIPAFILYILLQSIFLRNARELQHMEAESAARVVSLATQTLAGAVTVRAGRLRTQMRGAFCHRLDQNHSALLLLNSANRWLSLSMDMVGAASVFASLSAALYGGGGGGGAGGGAAAAGLAAAYALLLPAFLAHLAKSRADLDLQLASLQRLHTDTNIPQEDYRDDCPIPSDWQRDGKIEFQDISVQHQEDAAPVLKNINLIVKPSQKVAICGRSGSGKSTLLLTCAGATTIHSGRVLIDGQDILHVPLRALRHRVVVLPQEAIMFSGTLRENLDPLAVHTDEEIWRSLRAVGLYDHVTAQSAGLECSVSGWRGGWGGRRARVCAARAALHAQFAAALLLDEPGAALDAPAERVLLQAFSAIAPNTTIITVAHRVSSVRGYDKVVVLEDGEVAEQGDLDTLLSEPSSSLSRALAAQYTQCVTRSRDSR